MQIRSEKEILSGIKIGGWKKMYWKKKMAKREIKRKAFIATIRIQEKPTEADLLKERKRRHLCED